MNFAPRPMPAYTGPPHDPHRPPHEPPVTALEVQRWSHERIAEPVIAGDPVVQPIPSPGDLVAVRLRPWGPTVPARVIAVQPVGELQHPDWSDGDVDPNLWHQDDLGNYAPKWDPWPDLELETLPLVRNGVKVKVPFERREGRRVRCKEARVRGSAGWLWPGHILDTPWEG